MSALAIPPWSGPMRHRIAIQRRDTTIASDGGEVATWTTLTRLQAAFEERQPREPFAAGREIPMAKARFKIRYRGDLSLDETMRVLFRDEAWEIERIENVRGGNVAWVLHCALRKEDATS